MLRGNVEEGSIFLTPIFPSHMRCMNNPNVVIFIAMVINHPLDIQKENDQISKVV